MRFTTRFFFPGRASNSSPRRDCVIAERLENRRLLTNTVGIEISANLITISAKDQENVAFSFKVHDVVGMLTVTGENVAAQTVGRRVIITGTTTEIDDLSLTNTTASSTIAVQGRPNGLPLLAFESMGPMRSIDLHALFLAGTMNILSAPRVTVGSGSRAAINIQQNIPIMNFIGGSFSDSLINITPVNPATESVVLKFNDLTNTHINTDGFIKSATLHSVTESIAGGGGISANCGGTFRVSLDYKADLTFTPTLGFKRTLDYFSIGGTASDDWNVPGRTHLLRGRLFDGGFNGSFGRISHFNVATDFSGTLTAGSVRQARVGDNVIGATITLTKPFEAGEFDLCSLRIGNLLEATTITAAGSIGTVSTMFTDNSRVTAGLSPTFVFGQPITLADYTADASIKSFISDCPSHHYIHFVNSFVSAYDLESIHLGNFQAQNGGLPFGMAGFQMDKVSLQIDNKTVRLKSLFNQAELDAGLLKYHVSEPSLGDFKLLFPSY